ncbi:hypothetical protein OCU04_012665 [Sclerotinia nivalis]|uniref:Uncharacterized protein n=1 Tax=Sclerotinia nivalis TaxID=352851 RepID=A0A9X0A958_9HELO|nr:hypothetical protein OCU04_012665 [Sclerotinia nivalis]
MANQDSHTPNLALIEQEHIAIPLAPIQNDVVVAAAPVVVEPVVTAAAIEVDRAVGPAPVIKQEPGVAHPPRRATPLVIDLVSDSDDEGVPPAAVVIPPGEVINLTDDNEDMPVEVPSPSVPQNRVVLNAAAGVHWTLAKVLRFWMMENSTSQLGPFQMGPAHIDRLQTMLMKFKGIYLDSRIIHGMPEVDIAYNQLDDLARRIRDFIRTYRTSMNTFDQLFLPHTLNEVRNIWRYYTANGANLQIGKEILVQEHFDGFFPVLFKNNQ